MSHQLTFADSEFNGKRRKDILGPHGRSAPMVKDAGGYRARLSQGW